MSERIEREAKKASKIIQSLGLKYRHSRLVKLHKKNRTRYDKILDKCFVFKSSFDEDTPLSRLFMAGDASSFPLLELPGLAMYNSDIRSVETPREFYDAVQEQNIIITPINSDAAVKYFLVSNESDRETFTLSHYLSDKRPIVFPFSSPLPSKKKALRRISKTQKSLRKLIKKAKKDNKRKRSTTEKKKSNKKRKIEEEEEDEEGEDCCISDEEDDEIFEWSEATVVDDDEECEDGTDSDASFVYSEDDSDDSGESYSSSSSSSSTKEENNDSETSDE